MRTSNPIWDSIRTLEGIKTLEERLQMAQQTGYSIKWAKVPPGPVGSIVDSRNGLYAKLTDSDTECYSYVAKIS